MTDSKVVLECTRDLTLLYVEDDPLVREQTQQLLETFFSHVESAENGEEGLAKYQAREAENGSCYDIVMTDIRMPKMDGIALSKAIFDLHPDQTIIVLSAYNDAEYLMELINLGIANFIGKPLHPDILLRVLYRTSQAITDKKLVEKYYAQIDQLNAELMKKNEELEKTLRVFETKAKKNANVFEPAATAPQNDAAPPPPSPEPAVRHDDDKELATLIATDLPELHELYEEMDALIVKMSLNRDYDHIGELAELIDRYGSVLSGFYVFYEISAAFKELALTMLKHPFPEDESEAENILLMLESFGFTLQRWQQEWSEKHNVTANFFDDSLTSDIKTIINLWTHPASGEGFEEGADDGIEFF